MVVEAAAACMYRSEGGGETYAVRMDHHSLSLKLSIQSPAPLTLYIPLESLLGFWSCSDISVMIEP